MVKNLTKNTAELTIFFPVFTLLSLLRSNKEKKYVLILIIKSITSLNIMPGLKTQLKRNVIPGP